MGSSENPFAQSAPDTCAKTVLITGAGGFIGHHIVREFVQHHWTVYALVHRRIPSAWSAEKQIHLIHGDLLDPAINTKILAQMPARPSIVVHAAGLASDVGPEHLFRELNFATVPRMASLAQHKLVYISSSDVYGIKDF